MASILTRYGKVCYSMVKTVSSSPSRVVPRSWKVGAAIARFPLPTALELLWWKTASSSFWCHGKSPLYSVKASTLCLCSVAVRDASTALSFSPRKFRAQVTADIWKYAKSLPPFLLTLSIYMWEKILCIIKNFTGPLFTMKTIIIF
jgi:hypothetical protein